VQIPLIKGIATVDLALNSKHLGRSMKPRSPLPWTGCLGDVIGADKIPVVLEIGSIKNADHITHACNAYPKLVEMLKKCTRKNTSRSAKVFTRVFGFEICALLKSLGNYREGVVSKGDAMSERLESVWCQDEVDEMKAEIDRLPPRTHG
jgi:hypothetical protein